MQDDVSARFWAKVDQSGECWVWTGALHRPMSYGRFKHPLRYAHRVSWQLHYGPIPAGLHVLHRCDNPPCVRPDHLFVGSPADNMGDATSKGRCSHGEAHVSAKLTDDDVRAIRSLATVMSVERIAARYGMSYYPIYAIVHRRTWKHVD